MTQTRLRKSKKSRGGSQGSSPGALGRKEPLREGPRSPARNAGGRVRRGRYKRPFDIAVIAIACVVLFPLLVVLALAIPLAIRLEDGGRVLYFQPRLGRDGKIFNIMKFRTMVQGAESATGPVWAARRDARATAVGRVLRLYHLDELPQLINILRGDMSLVGPRPERPELAERFRREVPDFSRRLRVRPGVMGLAQARGGYHFHPRRKLRYDDLYIETMGPMLDLKLCALCLWKAFNAVADRDLEATRKLYLEVCHPAERQPG